MNNAKDAIAKFLQSTKLHSILRLRHRSLLTRSNRLRLRYTTCIAAIAASGIVSTFNQTQPFAALTKSSSNIEISSIYNEITPFSGDIEIEKEEEGDDTSSRVFPKNFLQLASIKTPVEPPSLPTETTLKLGKGDTVAGLLQEAGVSGSEAFMAVNALQKHFDVRKAKPGQSFDVKFKPYNNKDDLKQLASLNIPIDAVKSIVIEKQDDEFKSSIKEKKLSKTNKVGYAKIQTSLYGSAIRSGIPTPVIARLIRMYSWSVDFQRDIRRGDIIKVMYETYETPDGEAVKYGDIYLASLNVGGTEMPLYLFKDKNGHEDYYDDRGHSAKKTLMRTPVDGARISSGFGMRKHPILGYNKMHKGMDFAASLGTPIYAAGDGVINKIGPNGAYGNYARIRHNSNLQTAYAHMHKFGKGMTKGKRVKQGDIIGYVGSTGRSTGPHLHYEVLLNGKQVNPTRIDLPVGERLKGKDLERFNAQKQRYAKTYANLSDGFDLAETRKKKSDKPS